MTKNYLIADIGGTNIRLAIIQNTQIKYLTIYKVSNFNNIYNAISFYIKSLPNNLIVKDAIIAIAATIFSENITMTNINWHFNINELKQNLNFNSLKIINDFEAQALSLDHLQNNDFITIYKNKNTVNNNTKLILGPGTGLGVSLVIKNNNVSQIIPSEAGHTVIGFYNDKEKDVLNFITKQLNCEPYAEKIISGHGIVNIYNALCFLNSTFYNNNISALDIYNKVKNNDLIALETFNLFFNFLGTFVSNCILSFLPYNGLYLTGGILPALKDYLIKSNFIDRLENKNLTTVKNLIQNTPVYLITAENPAMIGLQYLANKNN